MESVGAVRACSVGVRFPHYLPMEVEQFRYRRMRSAAPEGRRDALGSGDVRTDLKTGFLLFAGRLSPSFSSACNRRAVFIAFSFSEPVPTKTLFPACRAAFWAMQYPAEKNRQTRCFLM